MFKLAQAGVVLLAMGSALPVLASEPEFEPTPDQLRDYHDVYKNRDVRYLREVFDRAIAGKKDGETKHVSEFGAYLGKKFIVLSRDPVLAGGTQLTIVFQGRADRVFTAWVYDRHVDTDRFELRGFEVSAIPEEQLARIRARYRKFLEDPEHAM